MSFGKSRESVCVRSVVIGKRLLPSRDAKSAPNGGAVGLLAWVKISANNYGEFVRTLWTKLVPTKGHSESGPRFADDGRKTFPLLEEFEASFNAAEGQRIVELVKV